MNHPQSAEDETHPTIESINQTAVNLNFLRILQGIAEDEGLCMHRALDLVTDGIDQGLAAAAQEVPAHSLIVTDTSGPYRIEHFVSCDHNSSAALKAKRGNIIYNDGQGDQAVYRTFPWTPEYVGDAGLQPMSEIWTGHKFRIFLAHEGTLVRLWNHLGVWRLSTHRKLDARRSRWGGKTSHGDMFWKAVLQPSGAFATETDFLATLLPDRIYTFLVHSRTENRIVCKDPGRDVVTFAGEFDVQTSSLLPSNTSPLPWAGEVDAKDPVDLLRQLASLDPGLAQGFLVHYDVGTPNYGCLKLVNPSYQALADLRGNEPSVPFGYLKVRQTGLRADVDAYRLLYPEWAERFAEYERLIRAAEAEVLRGYQTRYVDRQFVVLPKPLWCVLQDLYYGDGGQGLDAETVRGFFNLMPATRLNRIIQDARDREREAESIATK